MSQNCEWGYRKGLIPAREMSHNCNKGVMFERDFNIYFSGKFSKVRGGGVAKKGTEKGK